MIVPDEMFSLRYTIVEQGDEIARLRAENEALKKELAALNDGLTTAYMVGHAKALEENATLKSRLARFEGAVRVPGWMHETALWRHGDGKTHTHLAVFHAKSDGVGWERSPVTVYILPGHGDDGKEPLLSGAGSDKESISSRPLAQSRQPGEDGQKGAKDD